jgi:hypothetical protein
LTEGGPLRRAIFAPKSKKGHSKWASKTPAIGLTFAVVIVNGDVEDGVWRLVGTMVVAAIFLQLGYVSASALQFVIGASRAADHSGASTRTSTEVPPSGQLRNRGAASSRFETNKQLRQA